MINVEKVKMWDSGDRDSSLGAVPVPASGGLGQTAATAVPLPAAGQGDAPLPAAVAGPAPPVPKPKVATPEPLVDPQGHKLYIVEHIEGWRGENEAGHKVDEYKVKWTGYTERTWEPAAVLNKHCRGLIALFWEKEKEVSKKHP